MHCQVKHISTKCIWECIVVYGFNHCQERASLWQALCEISDRSHKPWLVWGDFNNILAPEERVGSIVSSNEFREFKNCLAHCGSYDLKSKGCYFTWNNKQEGGGRVYCKLDRILFDEEWHDMFPNAIAEFLPKGIFDHTPMVVTMAANIHKRKAPFRYYNWWKDIEGFSDKVASSWEAPIPGNLMYRLSSKLKCLKHSLKMFVKASIPTSK